MDRKKIKIINYKELEELMIFELDFIRNKRRFCIEHNITQSQYIKISQIKNKKNVKKYTDLVITILNHLGYEIENETFYKIAKKDNLQITK